MAVKGYKRVTKEEARTIENYLRSGMSVNEIAKLTGRDWTSINRVKGRMTDDHETIDNAVELPTEEVAKTPEPVDTVRNHRDDPRFASNISIEMVAKIVGHKTGYDYRADFGKKQLTISTAEGVQLTLEFDVVERFLDEMIDISVEVGDLRRKFA